MSGLLSQSKRGVIAFSGFMLSARRRHFCMLSRLCERCPWRRSTTGRAQSLCRHALLPYQIRGTALPGVKAVGKFFTGLRTFLCAATAGSPLGYLVQWPPRYSCSQRSDDVDPAYWGLLYKLIWEDAERGKCVGPCSCTAPVLSCQWRQAEWLDLHVSLNVVVLNSLYACFWVWCSGQTTVSYGKSFCGVFVWALAPFVCLVCCFFWRNASLAGICGSSGWLVWWLVCCDLPAFPGFPVLVQMTFLLLMLM